MNIWQTLLWKEFHEHKWKALALTTIALSVLVADMFGDSIEGIGLVGTVYGYALLGPLYVAMGVSSAEQSNRSIAFVNALPFPTWKVGLVRILSGWLLLITPLVAVALFACLQISSGVFEFSVHVKRDLGFAQEQSPYLVALSIVLVLIGWSTSLYAWILTTTVNQKSEMRAGLIGLATAAIIIWGGGLAINWHHYSPGIVSLVIASSGPTPWLLWIVNDDRFSQTASLLTCLQAGAIVALLTFSVRRYGKAPLLKPGIFSRVGRPTTITGTTLKPPMKSPAAALLWMQYRQSAPIAVCALCITLLATFASFGAINTHQGLRDMGAFYGSLLALMIGTGAYVHQLEAELHTFWRSRPIGPRQWFWLKYAAGAFIIVACYDVPLFLLQRSTALQPLSPGMILFPITLHLLAYSLAVLAACGIRHSVYSVILAGSAVLAIAILPSLAFTPLPHGLDFLWMWERAARSYIGSNLSSNLWSAVLLLGPFIASSTLLAAWLIKRDISIPH